MSDENVDDIETEFWSLEQVQKEPWASSYEFFSVRKTRFDQLFISIFQFSFVLFANSEIFLRELTLGPKTEIGENIEEDLMMEKSPRYSIRDRS